MAATQGLLVQQQLHASGGGSMEVANGRPPVKQGSIQSADTVSMQAYSDPSEDAAAALPSSASMQSRPGSKVGLVIQLACGTSEFPEAGRLLQCEQAAIQLACTHVALTSPTKSLPVAKMA